MDYNKLMRCFLIAIVITAVMFAMYWFILNYVTVALILIIVGIITLILYILMISNTLTNLIDKLACHHEWELVRETDVRTEYGGIYTSLIFVCKKCGKFKKMKTNPG